MSRKRNEIVRNVHDRNVKTVVDNILYRPYSYFDRKTRAKFAFCLFRFFPPNDSSRFFFFSSNNKVNIDFHAVELWRAFGLYAGRARGSPKSNPKPVIVRVNSEIRLYENISVVPIPHARVSLLLCTNA